MTVLAIIKNLITVKVPYEIFDKSLDKTEIELIQEPNVQFSNRLIQFFYNLCL